MPTTWLDTVLRQTRRASDMPYPHWAAVLLNNPIRRFFGRPGRDRPARLNPRIGCSNRSGPGTTASSSRAAAEGRSSCSTCSPRCSTRRAAPSTAPGCQNVGFHSGDASGEFPFPDGTFDVAFLSAVLGEVPDKPACIRSLERVLRPGGLLVFVEAFPDPDRLSVATLCGLAEPEGFAFQSCEGTTWRDVVRFRRLPTL